MKIKRINVLLFLFMFALTNVFYNVSFAKAEGNVLLQAAATSGTTSDIEPGVLKSIIVDKPEVMGGEIVRIMLETEDPLVGSQEYESLYGPSWINYITPSGIEARVGVRRRDGVLRGGFYIDAYNAEPGTWQISNIHLVVNGGRIVEIANSNVENSLGDTRRDLSIGNFTVSGITPDEEPPVITAVSVDKSNVTGGEVVNITIDAMDNLSGIADYHDEYGHAAINYLNEDGGSRWVTLSLVDGKLQGSIDIKQYNTESGTWRIELVQFYDVAGNCAVVRNNQLPYVWDGTQDLSGGDFVVYGTTLDFDRPLFKSVSVDKTIVTAGEIVNITVEAEDSISGLLDFDEEYSTAGINYLTPSGEERWVEFSLANDNLVGSFSIDQFRTESGNWQVKHIFLLDKAGNGISIGNSQIEGVQADNIQDLSNGNFTVSGTTTGGDTPVITAVNIDKTAATIGERVNTTFALDSSIPGFLRGDICYITPSGHQYWSQLRIENNNIYSSKNIGQYSDSGTWKIVNIYLVDYNGNGISIGNSEVTNSWGEIWQDLSGGDFTVSGTNPDTEAPELLSVTADKTSVTAGDVVNITIDAVDDKSGIARYVEDVGSSAICFITPNGNERWLSTTLEGGKLIASLRISEYSEPGEWKIKYMDLIDAAGNLKSIGNIGVEEDWIAETRDLSRGHFTVYDTIADTLAPELKTVTVDKTAATAGEVVNITIEAEDDFSGITTFHDERGNTAVSYLSPSGKEKWVELRIEEGKLVGSINIGQYSESGIWRIGNIFIVDKAGNYASIGNSQAPEGWGEVKRDLSSGNFTVSGTTNDIEAPLLKNVAVDKSNAVAWDTVSITVEAEDAVSGLAARVDGAGESYIRYITETGNEKQINLSVVDGKLTAKIYVNEYTTPGAWKVKELYLMDKAGNTVRIGNFQVDNEGCDIMLDLSAANITVDGTMEDSEPPVFEYVTVDKVNVVPGDTVNISIGAHDDISGIANFADMVGNTELIYLTPSGMYKNVSINVTSNPLQGTIKINQYSDIGTWKLLEIFLVDKAGNRIVVGNTSLNNSWGDIMMDLSAADFTVSGTTPDIKAPIFTKVSVDKADAVAGDTVNITVEALDDLSGIIDRSLNDDGSWVNFLTPSGLHRDVELKLVDGKLVGKIDIGKYSESGLWMINFIQITDNAGNLLFVGNSEIGGEWPEEMRDLSSGSFTVTGTTYDIQPPEFRALTVDKAAVTIGDTVGITIDAVDQVSGLADYVKKVGYADITYITPSGRERIVALTLVDGKLTGNICVGQYTEPGEWKVKSVWLLDKAGNVTVIGNSQVVNDGFDSYLDLSIGNLIVSGTDSDFLPPEMNSINVDRSTAASGKVITITVEAADDKSGLSDIDLPYASSGILYISPSGQYKRIKFVLVNGKYVGYFEVDDQTELGSWKADSIILLDNEGNANNIVNKSLYPEAENAIDLSGADIEIERFCDFNSDSSVNLADLEIMTESYNDKENTEGFKDQYDVNNDGIVDIFDIVITSSNMVSDTRE
jgi:hypothetical protein